MDKNKFDSISSILVNECHKLAGNNDVEFAKMSIVADKILALYTLAMMENFPELLRLMANSIEIFEKEIGYKK